MKVEKKKSQKKTKKILSQQKITKPLNALLNLKVLYLSLPCSKIRLSTFFLFLCFCDWSLTYNHVVTAQLTNLKFVGQSDT